MGIPATARVTARIFRARYLLPSVDLWIDGGGLLVEGGRVLRVLSSAAAVRRAVRSGAREVDLGETVLAPGLVNAHAHLELSGLAGALPRGPDFRGWVTRLMELRAQRSPATLEADARAGADQLLATGTTSVGDVDSVGASVRGLAGHALRSVLFREVLDAQDAARTPAALARLSRALPRRVRRTEGIAPHAPFTVSPGLFAGLGALAARRGGLSGGRGAPVTMHWSETEQEVRWLATGEGPYTSWLGSSPGRSGLDLLEDAGLLRAPLALVHGNFPAPGEPARIAAAGAVLVHCPRSHEWFQRPAFPLRRYLRAGVPIALGTDSLASNVDLDLHREAARLRETHPGLAPEPVWRMMTAHGARALGLEQVVGTLTPGAWADFNTYELRTDRPRAFLEHATRGRAPLSSVAVAGRLA